MRGRSQDIVFGLTGQSLVWDAPEGRPSSVTDVQVFEMSAGDDDTEEVATTGAAAIDAVSTTVDAASGAGQSDPRKVNLTATSNIVIGRQYLLTDDDSGLSEWVEVMSIGAADHVIARDPLANAYSSGATFVGTRITIGVHATWVADEKNVSDDNDVLAGYRVRWTYVVGGVTRTWSSDLDLVRYPGGHSVLPADVEAMYPGYRQRLPGLHQADEGRRLLDEAHEQVRWDLVDVEIDDARFRSVDAINRATLLRFGVVLAKMRMLAGQTDPAAIDEARKDYETFMTRIVRHGPKVPIATSDTGAAGHAPVPTFWARR